MWMKKHVLEDVGREKLSHAVCRCLSWSFLDRGLAISFEVSNVQYFLLRNSTFRYEVFTTSQAFFRFTVISNLKVYNSIANTNEGALFLPPSDVHVRRFLYPFYTLIKLYYTKALSDQASFLALDWILLLRRPRILASSVVQQQPFGRTQDCEETKILQKKVKTGRRRQRKRACSIEDVFLPHMWEGDRWRYWASAA